MMPMFDRLLIANRGEIACRITDTAHRLGLHVIAIYSSADRQSRHVRMADEAHWVGDASPSLSYLNIEAIIEVALRSKAQAVHPGYGFLAENAQFAAAVQDAGLVFIGPSPSTIESMGSKAKAKALMAEVGVPIISGYHGSDQSDETLWNQAQIIGFPLMIKARSGGGGKGMRVVSSSDQFITALAGARREAENAFKDQAVILERYVATPRHIEAQILGDASGQVIHLQERDCSSQRRHQKIIEEAPSSGLPEALRAALLDAAVTAGRAVGYIGAGTVEFLVDPEAQQFYFLEMNTRLQVEHPVTEAITGLDLVEWQIRIAQGESLPPQADIATTHGHAFEARVYAEDPDQGFLPSTGRITALHWPDDVRIETGVVEGDVVSMHYDPMIAKLIVWGESRKLALERLRQALDQCYLEGPTTNIAFLQSLAAHPALERNTIDTGFLDRQLDLIYPGSGPETLSSDELTKMALAWWVEYQQNQLNNQCSNNPWAESDGWRLGLPAEVMTLHVMTRPEQAGVVWTVEPKREGHLISQGNNLPDWLRSETVEQLAERAELVSFRIRIHRPDHQPTLAVVHFSHTGRLDLCVSHQRQTVWIQPKRKQGAGFDEDDTQVRAPMPGKIVSIPRQVGDHVSAKEVVLVMEAMKMELSIPSATTGTIEAIHVNEGERVDANRVLMEILPDKSKLAD